MPARIFRRFLSFLVGSSESIGVEHRFFIIANLLLTFVQFFYLFFNLIVYPDVQRFLFNTVSLLFAGSFFLVGRIVMRRYHPASGYVEFVLYMVFYSVIWWINHGSDGPSVYPFFSVLALFVMFLNTASAILIAMLIIGLYLVLGILEFIHPEWLRSQNDPVQFFIRRMVSATLNLVVTATALIYLKTHYQKRRVISDELNTRLADQLGELTRAQTRIIRDEELYRITAVKTGQIVYDYDIPSGRILWAGAIHQVTGFTEQEFQSVNIARWEEMIHPEDRGMALETLEKSIRDLSPYNVTYRLLTKSGSYIFVQDNAVVLPGHNGRALRMIGTQKNITDQVNDRKELEKKQSELMAMNEVLAFSEARWRSLAESIPSNVLVLDRNYRVTYVQQVRAPFQNVEIIGVSVLKFIPEDQQAGVRGKLDDVLLTGQNRRIEFSIPTEIGVLWYAADMGPIRVRERVDSLIVSMQNITEIKNIQRELEDKKTELEKINATLKELVNVEIAKNREKDMMLIQQSRLAAMGEMINNIAHQWRQPLNATGIVIQTIEEYYKIGKLDAAFLRDAVDRAMKQIRHMSKTIDDFRNFFRSDREPEEFSVRKAVLDTLNLLDSALKNNYISVKTELRLDVRVQGFPNEYNQVLLNILNNAKEALVERRVQDPWIRIVLDEQDGRSVVTVSDNAGGIEPAALERVFDPYFTTKQSGTGIGLYMSKMIIEKNMTGTISVRNGENGAVFTVVV